MNKRLAPLFALAVAAVTVSAVLPANAEEVTVAVSNPGGSRTLYVENLLGQPLTSLDFGTTRSQPFRVRVVDSTMDRSGFQVLSTMTNLYQVDGASYDWDDIVPSGELEINYPPNPLNLIDVDAVVEPVFNLTSTLTGALCTTVTTAGGDCSVVMNTVDGLRQTVDVVVDLADLNSLPLIPQIGETGEFLAPDFAGIGANDPDKPGTWTPTNKQLISGLVNTATDTVDAVTAALQTLIGGQGADALVDADTLAGALRDELGGPVFDALLPSTVEAIIDALQVTLVSLTTADILGQSGTYLSYPKLDVTVPTGTEAGDYQGTLVVTAVQM